MHVFDDGVYANYAPASLYSNYSNYSELEVTFDYHIEKYTFKGFFY